MDFVDWCHRVLHAALRASASEEALLRGYLTDEALAEVLLGDQIAESFTGSEQRTRLHTALDELARNLLLAKAKLGQMYKIKVTPLGESIAKNSNALWKDIGQVELSSDAAQLLELINRMSQRSDEHLIWLEDVARQDLPLLGWGDPQKRMRAVRELEHYRFVRSYPPQGSDLDLTATYRGIVWQTRRAPEIGSEPEIAHVLFSDIVGYSLASLDIQTQLRDTLKSIVRATETFRAARAREKVISRPTGDGVALIFFGHPASAVKCAIEINRAIKSHSEIKLRLGVHSGPVRIDEDINDALDVAGGGINLAQRVMDAGDASHILVSKSVADNLNQLGEWSEHLHDLGEITVKHGVRIQVFNMYGEDFGNSAIPHKVAAVPSAHAVIPPSTQVENIRLALISEMNVNLDLLREIWNSVLSRVKFRPNHPMARVQKSDAIRAIVLPRFRRDKWDRLLSEAIATLSNEEFEKVERFYSRLERLIELRSGELERWRVEADLIFSDFVANGNPLEP